MSQSPLQATIVDTVPLGRLLLLSVRGLSRRPDLPADGLIVQTGERVQLLEQPESPSMWLLSQVTLLAEPVGETNWKAWQGKTLEVLEVGEGEAASV
ncbi:hypothetical protein Q0M94_00410 [Deinococcus radiomollis]|uniref:hypothetical protein n=1 Tax=Deinococcus radiomollis TaxID=468916 RepID=UPI00389286AA